MIYILKGNEEYFIKEKLKEIIKEDSDLIELDGSSKSFSISTMLEACQTNSLFASSNTVLVKNPYFLIKKEENVDELMNYINNPLYESDLILYTNDNSFNERLKLYKEISKNVQVISCDSLNINDFNQYAGRVINDSGLKLNNENKRLLIELVNGNASLLHSNIEILKLYPEEIDNNTIRALCSVNDEMNIFDLINALTSKDVSKSIELSRKLLQNNDSILPLISMLAGQLRYLYWVAYLNKQGNSLYDIMNVTGSKEFRVKSALRTLNNLSMNEILKLLFKLHEIDIKVKTNYDINEINRLEYFILNLLNGNE